MAQKMTQLLVRNVEEQLKSRLQRRAKRNGRSMEAEAREILRDVLRQEDTPQYGLGTEISNMFRGIGLREGEDMPELHFTVEVPKFEL